MKYKHFTLIALFITANLNIAAQVTYHPYLPITWCCNNKPMLYLGEAKPGKKVTITTSWDNNTLVIKADERGNGKQLQPEAGGPYEILIASGKKHHVKLKNVSIGEVWICSENPIWNAGSQ